MYMDMDMYMYIMLCLLVGTTGLQWPIELVKFVMQFSAILLAVGG